MTIVSNKENTVFYVRPIDGEWREVGRGKVATTEIPSGRPCEVKGVTPGYVEKTLTLAEPLGEAQVQLVWMDPGDRLGRLIVTAKVVAVVNGEIAPIVTEVDAGTAALRDAVRRCADGLARDGRIKGRRVAVLRFAAGGPMEGQAVAARDILGERLREIAGVTLIERDELSALVNEADLRAAGLVGTASQPGRLADAVDYVVTGTVSVAGE